MTTASANATLRHAHPSLGKYIRNLFSNQGEKAGVAFTIWQPNAKHVSVVGPFNGWDGRRHRMTEQDGTWTLFIPISEARGPYKYEVTTQDDEAYLISAVPYIVPLHTRLASLERRLVL